jgi:hypothetical protein
LTSVTAPLILTSLLFVYFSAGDAWAAAYIVPVKTMSATANAHLQ